MKRLKLFMILVFFCCLNSLIFAQLTVTATTSTNNARYSPRNVTAMWIENSGGQFIKTILLRSASRTRHLYTWVSRSGWTTSDGYQEVDGWSGATRSNHNGTVSGTWDLTDSNGNTVPPGTYQLRCEFTEEHAQGPMASGSILIDGQSKSVNISAQYVSFTAVYTAQAVPTPTRGPTTAPPTTAPPTPAPTTTVTLPPTQGATPIPNLLGDVNGSGQPDIVDALMTAQYYVGLNPPQANIIVADVDCSGAVNIVDALIIAQYYVGLVDEFPCHNQAGATISDLTYYISGTGNDNNAGTEADPWETLQKACNTVRAGDTVFIKAGTYNERITFKYSGSAGHYITFRNYGNDEVVINGSTGTGSHVIDLGNKAYIRISGLEIANNAGDNGAGININGGKYIILENNSIHHNTTGIRITAQINDLNARGVVVKGNIIFSNLTSGIILGGSDYPVSGKAVNCHIYNNVLYNNDTSITGDGEISILWADYNQLKSNIIYTAGARVFLSTNSPGNNYNVFDFNLWYADSGSGYYTWNSNTYNGFAAYSAASGQDGNSISANPFFVNASSSKPDFRLQSGSPAIDAGNPAFAAGDTDRDGRDRLNGTRLDIGAYEFY